MAILSDYTAGTVSIGAGGTALVGTGTAWLTAGFREGDEFFAAGWHAIVGAVNSNTSITLLPMGVRGAALAGAPYRMRYQSDGSRASAQARQFTDLLGKNGNLESLAGLTLAADRGLHATGAGALATHAQTPFARTLLDDADAAAARATLGLLSRSATQSAFRGAFELGSTDLTPEQTYALIGGNGYYNCASSTGGNITAPPGWPSSHGQVVGYHAQPNNHAYSWQEFTSTSGTRSGCAERSTPRHGRRGLESTTRGTF